MAMESKAPSSFETGSIPEKLTRTPSETPENAVDTSNTQRVPVDFDTNDPDKPRNFPQKKKITLASFVLLSAFVATFGVSIYIAAVPEVEQHFQLTTIQAIAPISLYAYCIGIGALLGTAACEMYGRRIVFHVTIPISLLFTIAGGCAQNFTTLAISRALVGLFCGPCLTVGVGILNDIWDLSLEKIGTAFAVLFVLLSVWATQMAPMVSAAVVEHRSWRWTFWVFAMLIGVSLLGSLALPETFHPQIIRARAKKSGQPLPPRGTNASVFLVSVGRPLHMMFVEPIIFPTGLVLAVQQSVVFAYYVGYALLFERVYGFSQYKVGMAFGPLVVGSLLAVPVVGLFDKLMYQKAREEALTSDQTVAPEKRLYPAMLGSITLPISLFWLAWSGKKEIHYFVPILSGGLFGFSYLLNMLCLPIYNNDVYTIRYGASTLAASTFMRFIFSANFPLFTVQMIDRLGFAWATSLLGFITVAMIPIPWVFWYWGPMLRGGTKYLKHLEATQS